MKPTRRVLAALSLQITLCLAAAGAASPANVRLEKIQQDYALAQAAYERNEKTWAEFDLRQAGLFAAALALTREDPKSEAGFAALEWMLTIPRAYFLPPGIPAMQLATEHHAANPRIGRIVAHVGNWGPDGNDEAGDAVRALIRAVAEKNPDRLARGQALFTLVRAAKASLPDEIATPAVRAEVARVERDLEAIAHDYGECLYLTEGERTLGQVAQQELHELRHLRIGRVAPEIDGEDLAGAPLRLGDFRGRVTVLVFWATWCGPCMQMVPHERELVSRLAGKPFALLGVNGDADRATARKIAANERMTWRSFWNGPEGADGPLSRTWNVRSWPTVYVFDAKGVIRAKGLSGEDLDKVVDRLLAEMK